MLKYLLLIALGAVVWWIWRQRAGSPIDTPKREAPPEPMVACAHCGIHQPVGECLTEGKQYYCCEAHRKAGPVSPSR